MNMYTFRARCLQIAIAAGCAYFIVATYFRWTRIPVFIQNSNDDLELEYANDELCLVPVADQWRKCIQDGLYNQSILLSLINVTTVCAKLYFNWSIPLVRVHNHDETKVVILPVNKTTAECNLITLGVGNDIAAEKELQEKHLPQCKFYGADPIYESGKVYQEIGEYWQVAVSGEDGNTSASVLDNNRYQTEFVRHISFVKFMKMTKVRFVDYLFLDAEGGEYGILPMLETDTRRVLLPWLTVCQINVELHMWPPRYGLTNEMFDDIMNDFIANSPFLPIIVYRPGHFRTVWINMYTKTCLQKFLPNLC